MSWFKKFLPYLAGAGIGILIYGFINSGDKKIEEIKKDFVEVVQPHIEITEESNAEQIYCPPIPECKPKVKIKTVYRDRIIHTPKYKEPGCYANWETGEHEARTGQGANLRCVYDNVKRTMKTYFTMPDGLLRRGRP